VVVGGNLLPLPMLVWVVSDAGCCLACACFHSYQSIGSRHQATAAASADAGLGGESITIIQDGYRCVWLSYIKEYQVKLWVAGSKLLLPLLMLVWVVSAGCCLDCAAFTAIHSVGSRRRATAAASPDAGVGGESCAAVQDGYCCVWLYSH
jgi:hypothetical protein